MLNLVYKNTNDEKIYQALSRRIKDRYDLFGSLPDTIDDGWIADIEHLDEHFSQFTQKKRRANAFELRYGKAVMPEGPGWELCEKVLSRREVVELLSTGWHHRRSIAISIRHFIQHKCIDPKNPITTTKPTLFLPYFQHNHPETPNQPATHPAHWT